MTSVSISEAARLTGKTRDTLHRHIKTGKLSALSDSNRQGARLIDVSELIRVYGPLVGQPGPQNQTGHTVSDSDSIMQHQTPEKDRSDSALQVEVKMLRELLAEKDKRLAEKGEQIDAAAVLAQQLMQQIGELTSTVRLIEDKTSKRKGWWPWSK